MTREKHATCANNSINYTFNYIWLSNHLLMNIMFCSTFNARFVPFFSVVASFISFLLTRVSRNSTSTDNICGSIRKRLVCRMNKELCLKNGFPPETTTQRLSPSMKPCEGTFVSGSVIVRKVPFVYKVQDLYLLFLSLRIILAKVCSWHYSHMMGSYGEIMTKVLWSLTTKCRLWSEKFFHVISL